VPLACYDQASSAIKPGPECLAKVPSGTEVRLSSIDSEYNMIAGDRTEPQCMAGSGNKDAIAVDGITEGAQFVFGTYPRSTMKLVSYVGDDTLEPSATRLDDEEKEKLAAAIGSLASVETVSAHQKAQIDYDGNGTK